VTTANTNKIEELVALGQEIGVSNFLFREVFYYPDSEIVDHKKMPALVLKENDFASLKQKLPARFPNSNLVFCDGKFLDQSWKKQEIDSLLVTAHRDQKVAGHF
jgi:hypothetical protein